jgi:hypothetical protein
LVIDAGIRDVPARSLVEEHCALEMELPTRGVELGPQMRFAPITDLAVDAAA